MKAQVDAAGGVVVGTCEETLIVTTEARQELHFRRDGEAAQWSMLERPYKRANMVAFPAHVQHQLTISGQLAGAADLALSN